MAASGSSTLMILFICLFLCCSWISVSRYKLYNTSRLFRLFSAPTVESHELRCEDVTSVHGHSMCGMTECVTSSIMFTMHCMFFLWGGGGWRQTTGNAAQAFLWQTTVRCFQLVLPPIARFVEGQKLIPPSATEIAASAPTWCNILDWT
jgi:hypothetical protein